MSVAIETSPLTLMLPPTVTLLRTTAWAMSVLTSSWIHVLKLTVAVMGTVKLVPMVQSAFATMDMSSRVTIAWTPRLIILVKALPAAVTVVVN